MGNVKSMVKDQCISLQVATTLASLLAQKAPKGNDANTVQSSCTNTCTLMLVQEDYLMIDDDAIKVH